MATVATRQKPITINQIEVIATQITQILDTIKTTKRLLLEQRLEAGKLLIELRNQFSIQNQYGGFRGSHRGSFCSYAKSKGWNIGTCYEYIRLVEGREPTKVREAYWQKLNRRMKNSTGTQKITLLKRAVTHLIKLYEIPAVATILPSNCG